MPILSVARRVAATVAAAGALATGVAVAAAPAASAAPQAPAVGFMGTDVVPVPSGPCNGTIAVGREVVPGAPDEVKVTLTPTGTYGSAPGCDVPMSVIWINGIAPFSHRVGVTVAGGPTSVTIPSGRGLSYISATGAGTVAWPVGHYTWLQP